MNDNLQTQLTEVLSGITNAVATASDFVVADLPNVAQQYIMFGMAWHTSVVLTALIVAFFGCRIAWCAFQLREKQDDSARVIIMFLAGVQIVAVSVVLAAPHAKSMLLVWFAPKIYLLQGIAGLVK